MTGQEREDKQQQQRVCSGLDKTARVALFVTVPDQFTGCEEPRFAMDKTMTVVTNTQVVSQTNTVGLQMYSSIKCRSKWKSASWLVCTSLLLESGAAKYQSCNTNMNRNKLRFFHWPGIMTLKKSPHYANFSSLKWEPCGRRCDALSREVTDIQGIKTPGRKSVEEDIRLTKWTRK